MAPKDIISRTLDAGRGVGQRSQDRIEGIVGQLQRMSEEQLDQVVALVGELRDRSVLSGEQVASTVDRLVREQFSSLGLATKADMNRLEAKLDALTTDSPKKVSSNKASSKKASSKKGAGAKASPKKTHTSEPPPEKSSADRGPSAGSRPAG